MVKAFSVVLLLALAGCSGVPPQYAASPCATSEASYACQIERYFNVSAD
jgi:hypothetical protein